MSGRRQEGGVWWLIEAALLGFSAMTFLTLGSLGVARLLCAIGLVADYNYPESGDAETGALGPACYVILAFCVITSLILASLLRLWRRRS